MITSSYIFISVLTVMKCRWMINTNTHAKIKIFRFMDGYASTPPLDSGKSHPAMSSDLEDL
jgi:hypothetical protein